MTKKKDKLVETKQPFSNTSIKENYDLDWCRDCGKSHERCRC